MNPVHDYHERSKHHLNRYAPGPGRLDWATQPDPFRRFEGSPVVDLPLLEGELDARWDDLYRPDGLAAESFGLKTLSHLLQLSLGLSAWKSYGGSRWALRCNPSSGNLHPTEGYLICPDLPGLAAGVYHYQPEQHRLERRAAAPLSWTGGVFVALTGIHWREAWKYGMRAFRYCQHDCGHALAGLSYAAAALGWPASRLGHWSDGQIGAVTGTDRDPDFAEAEREEPEAIVWLGAASPPPAQALLEALADAAWSGQANTLSPGHRAWPDIDRVATATRKPATEPPAPAAPLRVPPLAPVSREPASGLIRRRRSAQAFDGVSGIGAGAFFRILDALLPRAGRPPWSTLDLAPSVHPVLFVHRVRGLDPGLYCLPRDAAELPSLKAEMNRDWQWAQVPGCPAHVPLYLLAPADVRDFAAAASCHQDIAADSAFSLAMLARFDDISEDRPWLYRERFWEAGMLGQVLYLEAEAAGIQGTGIGCYFDDTVHEALGLETRRFQDIYHFTVGTARVDARLTSEPPYAHLADRRSWTPSAGPFDGSSKNAPALGHGGIESPGN
jgi:SagB-type dehydrogenase family enzyme